MRKAKAGFFGSYRYTSFSILTRKSITESYIVIADTKDYIYFLPFRILKITNQFVCLIMHLGGFNTILMIAVSIGVTACPVSFIPFAKSPIFVFIPKGDFSNIGFPL